jgi:alpha-beta hydrolase superfamily lysophospholipase
MKNEQYSWKSFDGLPMFAQTWEPPDKPKAVIALVHGVGDHSGRFPRLVEMFTAAGYAVSGFDQRGHGKSGGPRVHAPAYEFLLRDIDRHLDNTRERFPGLPLVLYGHSFGGAQALCYVLKRNPRLSAVVASSPGLASGVRQPAVKVLMGRVLSRIAPTLRIPLGSPMSSLSHDPAWIETSVHDPMFFETLSARIGIEQLDTNEWILAQPAFPLPLLIMQGTADQHVDPSVTISFAKRVRGDVTLKVWDGLGHELHNEVKRDEILRYALQWLDAHTGA